MTTTLRPLRQLSSSTRPSKIFSQSPKPRFQCLHTSPIRSKRLGPIIPTGQDRLEKFTKKEIENLKKEYTPEQIKSIEMQEEHMSLAQMNRAKPRQDMYALPYFTDLSVVDPFMDLSTARHMPGNDPKQPVPQMAGGEFLPGDEEDARNLTLARMTGYTPQFIKSLYVRSLVKHRVVNQTRLGKIQKMYVLSVAGNGDGLLGVGEGKATEIEAAIKTANYQAIRNMQPVPRYEKRTIHGDMKVKIGAVEVEILARPPGYGVRCSQYIFEMARCCGITDLGARVTRSRNPMNVIKAVRHALMNQKLPDTIARGRGKKIVDVRKVYYGGSTF